ncbi:MAG: hypothetical protein KBT04_03850 [Bacteroidales bacterium]|nr:hypothetical protein [Candidatus Colimorpha onthohippi]
MDDPISNEAKQELDVNNIQIASPGCEGNPGITGEIFSNRAAYFRNPPAGTEHAAKSPNRDHAIDHATSSHNRRPFQCKLCDHQVTFDMTNKKINRHYADCLFEKKEFFVKNELLYDQSLLKNAELVGWKPSDTSHNTNKDTIRLKRKTDYFYYYRLTIGNNVIYLHIGHYRDTSNLYLYYASLKSPKDMKQP